MRNPFKKREELKTEVERIEQEKEKIQNKTAKIDKLSKDLKKHLKENHIGDRLYSQWSEAWRG